MMQSIIIGVSACLLGEHVRYDGELKRDSYICDTLGRHFPLLPVCPEVGCGLPVPREAMQLEGDPAAPRLLTCWTRNDRTEQLLAFCSEKISELKNMNLCGFIFKERSPSCGLANVPLHCCGTEQFTAGLFAREVARCFPEMPLEEAESLNDPQIRNNFIEGARRYHGKMDVPIKVPGIDNQPLKAEQ